MSGGDYFPVDNSLTGSFGIRGLEIVGYLKVSFLQEATGEFKEITKLPKSDRRTYTEFTDTIQKYVNPSGSVFNKVRRQQ